MPDGDLEQKHEALKLKVADLENKIAQKGATNLPPGIKIPKFDGNQTDFYTFLKDFNILATASNWLPADCVRLLPLFLEGEAKELFFALPPEKKRTWRDLTETIAEQTRKLDGPMWARRMLAKAKMGQNTVSEFANKIKEWVDQASPDPDYTKEAREKEAIHYFINGLPTILKRKLFFMDKPTSLSEAIKQTKKVLQIKEELENDEKGDELKNQIAELRDQVNAISIENKQRGEEPSREYENNLFRGNNRGRANFRGINRGNWRGNSNQFMGRRPGGFGLGNPNYTPLGQNRKWNGNFGNSGRFEGGFRPQRGNFGYNRGNVRGRGNGRQNYRINMVGNDETATSSSVRRSPTPALTFLTMATIFCLMFGCACGQYQLCSDRVPTTPIQLPNITACTIQSSQKAAESKVILFLPVRRPKQFPVYNCYQKMIKICTENFLFIWKDVKSQHSIMRGVNLEECRKFKERMDITMKRLDENLWGTERPERVEYAWAGEKCTSTVNNFIERGQGGILDFHLATTFGHKLNPYKGWEELNRQTFIWEIPEPNEEYWATHFPVGEFVAEITEDAIVVESEQSVFYFEKEKSGDREGIIGVPDEAYKMSNDVFVVIHESRRKDKREVWQKIAVAKKERPIKKEAERKVQAKSATSTPSTVKMATPTPQAKPVKVTTKVSPTELIPMETTTVPTPKQTQTTPKPIRLFTIKPTKKIITSTAVIPKIESTRVTEVVVPNFKVEPTQFSVMKIDSENTEQLYKTRGIFEGKIPPKIVISTTQMPKIVATTKIIPTIPTTIKPRFATTVKPITKITTTMKPITKITTTVKPITKMTTTEKSISRITTTVKPITKTTATVKTTTVVTPTIRPISNKTTNSPNQTISPTNNFPTPKIITVTPEFTLKQNVAELNTTPAPKLRNAVSETPKNKLHPSKKFLKENDESSEIGRNTLNSRENEDHEIELTETEMPIYSEEEEEEDVEINYGNELWELERRRRTTVTTPDSNWIKKAEKSKMRSKSGQENKNMNTRVNYALYRLNEARKREYDQIYTQACENTNFQLRLAEALLQINPNEGIRKIFNRDDLIAKWIGENLEVGFCVPVTPGKIFWDRKIGEDCYEGTPVFAENSTFFIKPGTRELTILGKKMECERMNNLNVLKNETQKGIIRKLNESVNKLRPAYRNIQNPLVLKAGTIFESDSARIEDAMLEYRSKMNNLPSAMLRTVEKPNITEVINLIREEANETLGIVIGKSGDWVDMVRDIPEKAREAVNFLKGLSWALIAIPFVILLALIIYVLVKYRVIIWAGFRAGAVTVRIIRGIFGMKRQRTRVAAVPSAPEENPLDQEAYVLDYLPPRIIATITNDPRKLPIIRVHLNGLLTAALVDSCASVSYCRESIARKAGLTVMKMEGNSNLTAANDSKIQILGKVKAKIRIEETKSEKFGEWEAILLVSPDKHCPGPLLFGLPLLTELDGVIALGGRKVRIGEIWTNIISVIEAESPKNPKIMMSGTEIFEPRTENIITAHIEEHFPEEQNFLVNGISHQYPGIIIGRTLVSPGRSNIVTMQIMNAGNAPIKIYEKSHLANLEPIQINALPGDEIPAKDYIPPETRWHENLPTLPRNEKVNRKPSERIDIEGTRLSEDAQRKLKKIVDEFSDAFVGDDGQIGKYRGPIVHKIDLIPGSLPFHFRPYRYPPETQREIERQIKLMLDQNIIRESESEFASPIVMVPKADKKSWRFAIDYRALNKMTKKRVFHLPNIQELLDLMGAKKYYSCMDMQQGFMQIPMAPEDIEKTAFISHLGIYEFITMPFGLTAAPDTFQRVMNSLRRRLTAAMLIYLDDIIIGSENEEIHLKDIENFLRLLTDVGFKLKIEKCHWGKAEIRYLGFLLSEKGVRMDPKQVQAVQNFQAPKSLTELKSLLGALTYFRRFLKNFAHIARPLQTLTQDKFEGKIQENWGREQEMALQTLKQMLTSAPVLQSPRFGKPFIIECDASQRAIGAVLLQPNGPVAFISRALNRHEANYPSIEREALALVYSVKEFSPYIVGSGTTEIITDCSALTGMMKAKELRGRLEKYQVTLQGFDIKITYRPGKKNKAADFLSRYNIPGIENKEDKTAIQNKVKIEALVLSAPNQQKSENLEKTINESKKKGQINLNEIIEAQTKVKELAKIFYILKTGKIPKGLPQWKDTLQNYCLINGAIYHRKGKENEENPKLVIPYPLREKIFKMIHDEGHFGFEKTWPNIKNRFFWNGMREDTHTLVETCEACQKRKVNPWQAKTAPSVPIKPTEQPFQRVHCDLMGPLKKSERENLYVFLAIDSFSKWIMARAIPDQKAETVAETFIEIVVHQHSTPEVVVTDQGRQFMSGIFKDLSKIYGFEHITSSPYHQQSNGLAEGSMRIIANILSQKINEKGNNWDEILSHAVFTHNTSIQTAIKQSPFFVIHLRYPRMPTDQLLNLPSSKEISSDISVYTRKHTEKAMEAWKLIQEEILRAQDKNKKGNDHGRKPIEKEIEIGELVLLKKEVLKHKFDEKWSGPFLCVGIEKERNNIIIKSLNEKGKLKKVHLEKVKKFQGQATLPLRAADEPLNWHKYARDPNLEQEEAEESDEQDDSDEKERENNQIQTRVGRKNMSKYGFESSDDEGNDLIVALLKQKDDPIKSGTNEIFMENEVEGNEVPCNETEIWIENELTQAVTNWLGPNTMSLIPESLVKNHWETYKNDNGEQFVSVWIFGENFEMILSKKVDKIVLGTDILVLFSEKLEIKSENGKETYWESFTEDGQRHRIQIIPNFCITNYKYQEKEENDGKTLEINANEKIDKESDEKVIAFIGRDDLLRGEEFPEAERVERDIGPERERICTILEILLEESLERTCTGWLYPTVVPLVSFIPENLVDENWEIFINSDGERFVMGWLFGENFELYIRNEVDEIILGLEVQLLLGERWKLRVDAEIETYWETMNDNGLTYEMRRMPEIWITHKEKSDESEISESSINVITELKYLSVLDEVDMEEIERKNEDNNLISILNNNNAQIPSKNQNNELSGMSAHFEPLSDTDEFAKLDRQLEEMKTIKMEESQKSLMEEVEALKKEVTEMKKLKTSRKRKTIKTREEGTEEAEKNEKEAKKETEQKSSEKIRKEEELSKEKEPEITVLERENRIRLDDEISLNLELEEEERILFSTPRGAENEKMSYWQSCLNRVKSRGELEKGLVGKIKKPTDPIRVAKSEIKSAELNIWQKRSEEIPPEGKKINQLDCSMDMEREENRKKFESGKANWSEEKNIFVEEKKSKEAQEITALLLNLREKSLEIHDEAEKLMRKVEKAFELEEKREKRGALWQEHDVRWPEFERNNRRGRGNWNESRGGWPNQRGGRGWRRGRGQWHDRNEWGPSTSQQAEDFSKMAGWG